MEICVHKYTNALYARFTNPTWTVTRLLSFYCSLKSRQKESLSVELRMESVIKILGPKYHTDLLQR